MSFTMKANYEARKIAKAEVKRNKGKRSKGKLEKWKNGMAN
jgi:hypothetical protein